MGVEDFSAVPDVSIQVYPDDFRHALIAQKFVILGVPTAKDKRFYNNFWLQGLVVRFPCLPVIIQPKPALEAVYIQGFVIFSDYKLAAGMRWLDTAICWKRVMIQYADISDYMVVAH